MRTLISTALLVALLSGLHASAQEKALTPYSLVEVKDLLDLFKSTYKKKKVPQEDAINLIDGLKDAYRYFDSKGDEAPKEEIKAKAAFDPVRADFAVRRFTADTEPPAAESVIRTGDIPGC